MTKLAKILVAALILMGCDQSEFGEGSDLSIDSGRMITTASRNRVSAIYWIGGCTATAISHNTLLTAAHCVDDISRVCIERNVANPDNHLIGTCSVSLYIPRGWFYRNGNQYAYDVAIAIFEDHTFDEYFSVNLTPPSVNEKVLMVGYSSHHLNTRGQGTKRWGRNRIRSISPFGDYSIVTRYSGHENGVAVSPGDSGGPIMNERCEIIGVASRMAHTRTYKDSLHTQLAWSNNRNWLMGLSRSADAYYCGQSGLDPQKCNEFKVARFDSSLANTTSEFPCRPLRGDLAPADQWYVAFAEPDSAENQQLYLSAPDPIEEASVCIADENRQCVGQQVALVSAVSSQARYLYRAIDPLATEAGRYVLISQRGEVKRFFRIDSI